ncbi:hypothetical protein BJ508DRAFT_315239 [Ascobolus immersus RN42]|uniref:Uncharacterized protein n=1 Tax=Ascobolus immersus RN42 TaxID=1160509 RepID=A0A3N4HG69_ASCIM|nr:hypothetical protein BJ508DRAFT_315239 [Ascobolus immersus RN42]
MRSSNQPHTLGIEMETESVRSERQHVCSFLRSTNRHVNAMGAHQSNIANTKTHKASEKSNPLHRHSDAVRLAISTSYRFSTSNTPLYANEDPVAIQISEEDFKQFVHILANTNIVSNRKVAWDYYLESTTLTVEMPSFPHEAHTSLFTRLITHHTVEIVKKEVSAADMKLLEPRTISSCADVKLFRSSVYNLRSTIGHEAFKRFAWFVFQPDCQWITYLAFMAYKNVTYPSVMLETAISQSLINLHQKLAQWICYGRGRISLAVGFFTPNNKWDKNDAVKLPPTKLIAYRKGGQLPDGTYAVELDVCTWIVDDEGRQVDGKHSIPLRHFLYVKDLDKKLEKSGNGLIPVPDSLLSKVVEIDFSEYHEELRTRLSFTRGRSDSDSGSSDIVVGTMPDINANLKKDTGSGQDGADGAGRVSNTQAAPAKQPRPQKQRQAEASGSSTSEQAVTKEDVLVARQMKAIVNESIQSLMERDYDIASVSFDVDLDLRIGLEEAEQLNVPTETLPYM